MIELRILIEDDQLMIADEEALAIIATYGQFPAGEWVDLLERGPYIVEHQPAEVRVQVRVKT